MGHQGHVFSQLETEFQKIRKEFPALQQKFNNHDLVYLDSTNSSLKPKLVIDRINKYYSFENSNVHRGGYALSQRNTDNFEKSRERVARFINAGSSDEIVFVRGTTEAINLVAHSWGGENLKPGDQVLITELEHHANIVPWQMICEKTKANLVVCAIDENGEIDMEHFRSLLTPSVKLVAITACSNALGTIPDVNKIVEMSHQIGALVLVDGAQSVTLTKTDVQKLNCDFFVFSGHKIFGPTGIGVLFARKSILEQMPPYQGGGSMISKVTFEKTTYNDIPLRFEAGTPHIEGVIGLASALDFVESIGLENVHRWEMVLLQAATESLKKIPDIKIYGPKHLSKGAIISFNLEGAHHSDVAQILDQYGVCVRAGHHCCQPLMSKLNVTGTVRASFSIYNSLKDIECLEKSLIKSKDFLL